MKKRVICSFMVVFMISLSTCGSSGTAESGESTAVTEQESVADETTDSGENRAADVDTFQDPSEAVAFDYLGLKCIEEGTSRAFMGNGYNVFYCKESAEMALEEIPQALSQKFGYASSAYLAANYDSIVVEGTEEIAVNAQKILRIDGYIDAHNYDESKVKLPMRGYTFAKDGYVFELIAVLDYEVDDEKQEEMIQTIEAMILSLRSEA